MRPLSYYSESEKDRLWAHRLHEDVVLAERQNFFLVAQSLLIVAYADLLNRAPRIAAVVLAIAGILLTAAWFRVNGRQRTIVRYVQGRAVASLREFADTYCDRPRARIMDSTTVLTIIVPGLLGAVWVAFLVIAL
jgi:hypothetical protein